MKISAPEEYGLRCLIAVARHQAGDRPLSISEIARREGLSNQYAAKLLGQLRKHGLVKSIRGLMGGFILARPAHAISVIEALQAVGGGFEVEGVGLCSHFTGKAEFCVHLSACSMRPMWLTITRHISEFLQSLSIADLLKEEEEAGQRMHRSMQQIAQLPTRLTAKGA